MRALLFVALLITTILSSSAVAFVQKKQDKCQTGPKSVRNWEQIGRDYVFFDYELCPPDLKPAAPLVRIWITSEGKGIALEKWSQSRQGADAVVFFDGKTKLYTVYRDLNAIPLSIFKAERRSQVAADIGAEAFLVHGSNLVPLVNLTPDSADRVRKAFESADTLIKKAEDKVSLLYEHPRIGEILKALAKPFEQQK